jgi:hypothetical protein
MTLMMKRSMSSPLLAFISSMNHSNFSQSVEFPGGVPEDGYYLKPILRRKNPAKHSLRVF